jgi:hypothetical protein
MRTAIISAEGRNFRAPSIERKLLMSDVGSAIVSRHLKEVEEQLARYEHPLFEWEAQPAGPDIDVLIRLKISGVYDDPYRLSLKPREIEARGFQWEFQRQLYNCLHDYLVEMFTRSPHIVEL